ncbi:hypothetical protein M404DRAFT_71555, partial [Pisolithus tinctorius Marx 270]
LKIHPVVNVSWVKPYKGPLEGQTVTHPGPVVGHEGNKEFEVDYITNSCLKRNKLEDFYCHNPSAPQKLHSMDSSLFNSLFHPLENSTDTVPTFNCLEV